MYSVGNISVDFLAICLLALCVPLHGAKSYFSAVAKCPPCTKEGVGTVQKACLEEGQTLSDVDHEHQKDAAVVCKAFEGLLECVAKNVPQCLETMGEKYQSYTMTPWDCQMDTEHVKMFQNYLQIGCNGLGDDGKTGGESNYSIQNSTDKSKFTTYELNTTSTNGTNTANGNNWPASREKGHSDITNSVDRDQPAASLMRTLVGSFIFCSVLNEPSMVRLTLLQYLFLWSGLLLL